MTAAQTYSMIWRMTAVGVVSGGAKAAAVGKKAWVAAMAEVARSVAGRVAVWEKRASRVVVKGVKSAVIVVVVVGGLIEVMESCETGEIGEFYSSSSIGSAMEDRMGRQGKIKLDRSCDGFKQASKLDVDEKQQTLVTHTEKKKRRRREDGGRAALFTFVHTTGMHLCRLGRYGTGQPSVPACAGTLHDPLHIMRPIGKLERQPFSETSCKANYHRARGMLTVPAIFVYPATRKSAIPQSWYFG